MASIVVLDEAALQPPWALVLCWVGGGVTDGLVIVKVRIESFFTATRAFCILFALPAGWY